MSSFHIVLIMEEYSLIIEYIVFYTVGHTIVCRNYVYVEIVNPKFSYGLFHLDTARI